MNTTPETQIEKLQELDHSLMRLHCCLRDSQFIDAVAFLTQARERVASLLTDLLPSLDAQIEPLIAEWTSLVASLIPDIQDDYRASDDPDDDTPGMQLTVGFSPATPDRDASWHYQTGDNSYTGGAYGHPHWAVVSLYRDSNAAEVAEEIASQIGDLVCS